MATNQNGSNGPIDLGLLGALIRHARVEVGFKTAEDFAAAITEAGGYPVSKETIYKIEGGKQEPKLGLYLAMRRVLHPYEEPLYDKLMGPAIGTDWKYCLFESVPKELFDRHYGAYRFDDPEKKSSY